MTAHALNHLLLTKSPSESSAFVREHGVWLNARICEKQITNLFLLGAHVVQETLSKMENKVIAVTFLQARPVVKDVFELVRGDSDVLSVAGL